MEIKSGKEVWSRPPQLNVSEELRSRGFYYVRGINFTGRETIFVAKPVGEFHGSEEEFLKQMSKEIPSDSFYTAARFKNLSLGLRINPEVEQPVIEQTEDGQFPTAVEDPFQMQFLPTNPALGFIIRGSLKGVLFDLDISYFPPMEGQLPLRRVNYDSYLL